MKIYLIGMGPGNPTLLTQAAQAAISVCPVLVGAPRLLEPYGEKKCIPQVATNDIVTCIKAQQVGPVGVLLSGDVGFYSGATALRPLLKEYEVEVLPGISSLVYFCAKLGTPWQEVRLVSAHGRSHNAVGEIQSHEKTFVLTGGSTKAETICQTLVNRGLGQIMISVGEQLSYPEERIITGTAEQLALEHFDSLSVLLAVNAQPVSRTSATSGLPDDAFHRGQVPMTKEEVRTISLSKLRLEPHHILWDVGAGTGSVSVEAALAVSAGQVFAIERKEEALTLLEEHKSRFAIPNLSIISGTAPDALLDLPAPDRVFLGGTAGNLDQILSLILNKNPQVRVVINAVTLETLTEAMTCFGTRGLSGIEAIQVAVTRTREVGRYHMLDAQNPVWIISGEGRL